MKPPASSPKPPAWWEGCRRLHASELYMTIDKNWIGLRNRVSSEFLTGLNAFIARCENHLNDIGKCQCPCITCGNTRRHTPREIYQHIIRNGFEPSYKIWRHHGEELPPPPVVHNTPDPLRNFLHDVQGETILEFTEEGSNDDETMNDTIETPSAGLEDLIDATQTELYPGSRLSSLEFLAKLTHLKQTDLESGAELVGWQRGALPPPTVYPDFAQEPRNVRLGLAADGFNPFGNMNTAYSMWPVVLTTYNTPPWICMKESSLMLTMLIPGPKSPGKDIDVYLRPLVDELKALWSEGVITRDSVTNTNFIMKAILIWTINDYPARSSLSGWSGQGYKACSICNEDTPAMRVQNKIVYVSNRQNLEMNHPYRQSLEFNGKVDKTKKPRKFNYKYIEEQLNSLLPVGNPGKNHKNVGGKRKRPPNCPHNWTKISIFRELEYWKHLPLQHNLDVQIPMNIEFGGAQMGGQQLKAAVAAVSGRLTAAAGCSWRPAVVVGGRWRWLSFFSARDVSAANLQLELLFAALYAAAMLRFTHRDAQRLGVDGPR
ncbi:uncharacterized protein [Rutidosis leptorrhynchoides]|uniref:uncharacterized protein n=1 Tax=Rutidosis leptorrhynchoides TaxID=125765 RepID=UPI003A9A0E3B